MVPPIFSMSIDVIDERQIMNEQEKIYEEKDPIDIFIEKAKNILIEAAMGMTNEEHKTQLLKILEEV